MTSLEQTIQSLTPHLYAERAERLSLPPWKDMSHSNQCQHLSFDMMEALQNRGYVLRRELHQDNNGNWHYLLAHADIDAPPTDDDTVTDLNPWQYTDDLRLKGPVHTSRYELMQQLEQEGAPDYFIALRGLTTIVKTHQTYR